jgi:predicted permease
MEAIVDVVLPVFAIMLSGYLAGRAGLLGPASSAALNGFVYYVALPALFFGSMAQVDLAVAFNWPFIGAFFGGLAVTYVVALAVARVVFPNSFGGLSLNALSAVFSNTGYMGIPLLVTAFGEAGLLPAVIATVSTGAVVLGFAIALLEFDRSSGAAWKSLASAGLGVVKSPLVVAATLGLLYSASGLPLPRAIINFTGIVGAAAGPCALFAMGLFMVGKSMTASFKEVGWVCLLKLLLMPAVTYLIAFHFVVLDPLWAKAVVITAALPTGALVFVIAQRYELYVQRATSIIMLSTLISVVTLSVLFVLLEIG